jgi:hypothetical protein
MEDVLGALKVPTQEKYEEGVLESFLLNARRILCAGLVATTLLASVATLPLDNTTLSNEPLIELVLESESMDMQHRNDLSERLTAFLSLKAGWNNDELSQPINSDVVAFINRAMFGTEASDWQKWMIFPEQAGSVLLDYEADNCRASISVGPDGFSYMAYGAGFYDTADRDVLSENELLTFVRKVKQYGRS